MASPARMDRERFYFNTEPCRDFYPVEAPDALRPVGGGFTVMRYDDGDQTAAVGYTGDYRSLAMGFPFEDRRRGAARPAGAADHEFSRTAQIVCLQQIK